MDAGGSYVAALLVAVETDGAGIAPFEEKRARRYARDTTL
jgi:hypothetical protein